MSVQLGRKEKSIQELTQLLIATYKIQFPTVEVHYISDMSMWNGQTKYDPVTNKCDVYFGTQMPLEGKYNENYAYLATIKTIHHEFRHVAQNLSNFSVCGKYASEGRFDFIAHRASSIFYGDTPLEMYQEQYVKNIREVDAEQYAIEELRKTLSNKDWFPDIKDAGETIVDFLNEYKQWGTRDVQSFYAIDIKKPIESFSQVRKLFAQQMEDSVTRKMPIYYAKADMNSHAGILATCRKYPWSQIEKVVNAAKDGREQRRIFAAIETKINPFYNKLLTAEEQKEVNLGRLLKAPFPFRSPRHILARFEKNNSMVHMQSRPLPINGDVNQSLQKDFNDEFNL